MIRSIARALVAACFSLGLAQTTDAATFEVVVSGNDPTMGILMTGAIVEGDDVRFLAAVASAKRNHPDHRLRALALDSAGGLVDEAVTMVSHLRPLGLVTVVPDSATCASACALMFAAGTIKVVSPTARLGVHGAANTSGEQDVQASAATTAIAQVFGRLGAPASVIGRMVVTPPSDMTWLSVPEIEMFPLGFSQEIGLTEFPIILSGYDGILESQRSAGKPLSLGPWLPSQPMPTYQQAGPALPPPVLPSPYQSEPPAHARALIEQARQYALGYNFGMSRVNAYCRGNVAWVRGCNGGASYRAKPYYNPSIKQPPLSVQIDTWLDAYDHSVRTKSTSGWCGNGSEPSNDGCRVGGDAWTGLEVHRN